MRTLLLCSVALALTGCGASTPYVETTDPCKAPVTIPDRWLTDQQIELLWALDRRELLDCGGKVEVLSGRDVG
jgi:hypothetical protein